MKIQKIAYAAVLVACSVMPMHANAEIKVGVITSGTGPMALIGIPQHNSAVLLPQQVGEHSIKYIALDDQSATSSTVTAFKKLVNEEKVDAIIGPSGSPNAMSVIGFAAETGTPVLALAGTAALVLPMTEDKKWMFKPSQNDEIIAQALVDEMVRRGVKTLGLVLAADAFGESWNQVMSELAERNEISIVVTERFQRQDTSVTGQTLRVRMAKPDAVLIAAPGGAAVLPQATLFDQGYKGQIYQTHGAALDGFLKLGGKKVEGTVLAASLMLVVDEVSESHPSKKIAMKYIDEYKQRYGQVPATFGAAVYDAGLLLEKAIPAAVQTAKPGTPEFRLALRDALEQVTELPGTQGVYNITANDHSGFDERGRVLITVKDGKWKLLRE